MLGHIQVYRRPDTQAESDQTHGQDAESSSRARFWNPVRIGRVGEAVAKDFVAHGAAELDVDERSTTTIMMIPKMMMMVK